VATHVVQLVRQVGSVQLRELPPQGFHALDLVVAGMLAYLRATARTLDFAVSLLAAVVVGFVRPWTSHDDAIAVWIGLLAVVPSAQLVAQAAATRFVGPPLHTLARVLPSMRWALACCAVCIAALAGLNVVLHLGSADDGGWLQYMYLAMVGFPDGAGIGSVGDDESWSRATARVMLWTAFLVVVVAGLTTAMVGNASALLLYTWGLTSVVAHVQVATVVNKCALAGQRQCRAHSIATTRPHSSP